MDSPKCVKCLNHGLIGQTYKIAGKQIYKCAWCKQIYPAGGFKDIEFKWRIDPKNWEDFISQKVNGIGKDRLREIMRSLEKAK